MEKISFTKYWLDKKLQTVYFEEGENFFVLLRLIYACVSYQCMCIVRIAENLFKQFPVYYESVVYIPTS